MTAPAQAGVLGADALLEAFELLEVEVVFGLPGVHNLALWKALAAASIRLVGVRHEQAAVYAADGYARATGRLGVALVTTGPGAANTLGATGEAMASGSPVLVIATDIPTTLRRPATYRGVLHETRDQAAMFAPVTKRATSVASGEAPGASAYEAGLLALAAPSGAVYLGVPTDLLSAATASSAIVVAEAPSPSPPLPADLGEAVGLVLGARRPLVWAGGGALRADAGEAVGELARRLAAPVLTTYMARGLLAPDHPCAVPGPVHLPAVGELWDEADLVIAIGTDFDGMMTQNWAMPAPARLLAINIDPLDATKNYRADLTLVGDARTLTAALAAAVPERAELPALATRLDGLAATVRAAVAGDEPQAIELLDALRGVLPRDAIVVADMCVAGYWLGGFYPVPSPRKLAYPVGWGTLGFAFPAALGTALAGVGRAVCVCGDGGFLFACGELATVAQEQLPLTIVIVDDGGYGMLRFDQTHAGDAPFGVDLQTPDFVAMAAAFDVPAVRIDGFGAAFIAELAASMAGPGPSVIVVNARLRPPPTTSPRWYRAARPTADDLEEQPA